MITTSATAVTTAIPHQTTEATTMIQKKETSTEPPHTTEAAAIQEETSTKSPQTTEATVTMKEIAATVLLQILRGVKSKMYCMVTCQGMVSCVSVMFDKESMMSLFVRWT